MASWWLHAAADDSMQATGPYSAAVPTGAAIALSAHSPPTRLGGSSLLGQPPAVKQEAVCEGPAGGERSARSAATLLPQKRPAAEQGGSHSWRGTQRGPPAGPVPQHAAAALRTFGPAGQEEQQLLQSVSVPCLAGLPSQAPPSPRKQARGLDRFWAPARCQPPPGTSAPGPRPQQPEAEMRPCREQRPAAPLWCGSSEQRLAEGGSDAQPPPGCHAGDEPAALHPAGCHAGPAAQPAQAGGLSQLPTQQQEAGEAEEPGCTLCGCRDSQPSGYGPRTLFCCCQCARSFHMGCLRKACVLNVWGVPDGRCAWMCLAFMAASQVWVHLQSCWLARSRTCATGAVPACLHCCPCALCCCRYLAVPRLHHSRQAAGSRLQRGPHGDPCCPPRAHLAGG